MFNKAKVKDIIDHSTDLSAGIYNGVVVDNEDPKQVGRIRVEIPELTSGIEKDHLPWYLGRQPFNTSPDSQAQIPPVGSEIIVEFPTNDIYNGIYSWVIISLPPSK